MKLFLCTSNDKFVASGLKQLVTPLLAGLMSNEADQSLSFEAFFTAVQQIVSTNLIYVFHAATCCLLHVYLPTDSRYTTACRSKQSLVKQDNVHVNTQSVQCIFTLYSICPYKYNQ